MHEDGHKPLRIGVTMSLSGPSEMNWEPVRRGLELWPDHIAGVPLEVEFADDAGDPILATEITQKMLNDGADLIVQFSLSGPAFAVAEVADSAGKPHFAMSPIRRGAGPDNWTFRLSPDVSLMADGVITALKARGVSRFAYIGTSDNYGESWAAAMSEGASAAGLTLLTSERYARTDSSTRAQAERIIALAPDAIVIGGPGDRALLPQSDLRAAGFGGLICQTFGAAMSVLADADSKTVDGTLMVTSPGAVVQLLSENHPARRETEDFHAAYAARFGSAPNSQAAVLTHDIIKILEATLPDAVAICEPGTSGFPTALRTAVTETPVSTCTGSFRYSDTDLFGLGDDARIMVELKGGTWHPAQ